MMKILAISYAFPPSREPRAIQVSRLLSESEHEVCIICSDGTSPDKNDLVYSKTEEKLAGCIRVPFTKSIIRGLTDKIYYRFWRHQWNRRNRVPDEFISWKKPVVDLISRSIKSNALNPDILVTFGHPFTDHLIGLEIKRLYGLPWIAHFSDPWADNPFRKKDNYLDKENIKLEEQVIKSADMIVMTSQETSDLVFQKYPETDKFKSRILPHSFDDDLYPPKSLEIDSKITIRHMGSLYGNRTAMPLLKAIQRLLVKKSSVLDNVKFEFIGDCDTGTIDKTLTETMPAGLISLFPSVDYSENLALMVNSDGLLLIDAPDSLSVFLPSKLIEYIGADNPIIGFTPKGAAAGLIRKIGGFIVEPGQEDDGAEELESFINYLSSRRMSPTSTTWIKAEIRDEYSKKNVAQNFDSFLHELYRHKTI